MKSASIVNTGLLVKPKVPTSEPTSASTCQHFFLLKNVNNKYKEPTAPIDVDYTNLQDYVRLTFTDINGNALTTTEAAADGAENAFGYNDYVAIVEQPAKANLKNKDLTLVQRTGYEYQATIESKKPLTVEGTYVFKVVLDNGNFKTVTVEVKEFQTPVAINLAYAAPSVELGGTLFIDKLEYVDANGVVKSAKGKVELATNGKGVVDFNTTSGAITVSNDDKYVGSEITVTAVDDRYDLIATANLTIADDAKELKFASNTADVDVNNAITIMPVDNNLLTAGTFKMRLTSNKVGNVTVQAIVKVVYANDKDQTTVVRYYTGSQVIAVGTQGVGDVVVMSIGSNEIVINDAKAAIDAAPIVENNRTFVPFRALAEAFGIKVIPTYDENGATADILFNL